MLSTAIAPHFGDQEEPMTMQVVMLCDEGLVFAGDLANRAAIAMTVDFLARFSRNQNKSRQQPRDFHCVRT